MDLIYSSIVFMILFTYTLVSSILAMFYIKDEDDNLESSLEL